MVFTELAVERWLGFHYTFSGVGCLGRNAFDLVNV
jgi:hypothetical protein